MVVEDSVVHLHVFEGDIKSLITQLKNTKDAYDRKVRELKKNLGEFDSTKTKKKNLKKTSAMLFDQAQAAASKVSEMAHENERLRHEMEFEKLVHRTVIDDVARVRD